MAIGQNVGVKNPMYGKKHKDREKFRKNTYSNVDYNNTKIHRSSGGNKRILYKMTCPQCNVDVGFRPHIDAQRTCIKCQHLNATKYSIEQKRIRCSMKANIGHRLRMRKSGKNTKSTFSVLDYTLEELMIHLQSKFKPGMTWDNYGEWEIDHIIPDSWFTYESYSDKGFKDSWSLKNLQPLWKIENASKSNKRAG